LHLLVGTTTSTKNALLTLKHLTGSRDSSQRIKLNIFSDLLNAAALKKPLTLKLTLNHMTNTERQSLINRGEVLKNRYEALMVMDQTPVIQDIIEEYMVETDRIFSLTNKQREYLYNFKTGGWNSEYALTTECAIEKAKARWADKDGLDIDEKSFRVSTPSDYANLLSLFH